MTIRTVFDVLPRAEKEMMLNQWHIYAKAHVQYYKGPVKVVF